jgi:hypothetical protein
MSDPIRLFTVIALVSVPTVMFGGFSLLRLLPTGKLTAFQIRNFRVGHAHAGVLLVLVLILLPHLAGTDLSSGVRWLVCLLLLVGVLAQSGGFFLHMAIGREGAWSAGNTVTAIGAILLTAAILTIAYGVATT